LTHHSLPRADSSFYAELMGQDPSYDADVVMRTLQCQAASELKYDLVVGHLFL
jgi:hypothetical protein